MHWRINVFPGDYNTCNQGKVVTIVRIQQTDPWAERASDAGNYIVAFNVTR